MREIVHTKRAPSPVEIVENATQIVAMVEESPMAEAVQCTTGVIHRVGTLLKGPDRAARIAASIRYRARRYLRQSRDYPAHR